ncbi:MAG: FAD-dependent thymidylate synthase [Candidatus Caldarchaeum sp.]
MFLIDYPSATLINYSADPLQLVATSAWASTGLSAEDLETIPVESRLSAVFGAEESARLRSPEKLIEFLAEHGHLSPFRHVTLTYLIQSDIATHIQLLKHRIGFEINSESARYKRLQEEYYVPTDLPENVQQRVIKHCEQSHQLYQEIYQELINVGYSKQRAKEASRFVLPYSKCLRVVATCSLQALGHFYHLRSAEFAQREIQMLALQMVETLKDIPHGEIFQTLIREGKLV